MSPRSRSLAGAGAAVALAVALSGCAPAAATPAPGTSGSAASGSDGAAPVSNGAAQVTLTLTGDDGGTCALDHTSAPAGPVTFTVTNVSATGITEVELQSELRIIGEKENLAPGLPASSFTVTLGGGTYTVHCPGAATESQPFMVTGEAAASPSGDVQDLLAKGTTEYAAWVVSQTAEMHTSVKTMAAALNAGDLAAAKKAYANSRPFYEKIEADVEGFVLPGHKLDDSAGSLDYRIDMRASSLDESVGWMGYHAIERDLFSAGKITAKTKKYAAGLVADVAKLVEVAKTLTFKPEDLANGAASLLEEVQSNKITGEEEAYSHLDLMDFANNLEGAQQAFAYLQPGLEQVDDALVDQVAAEFTKVDAALDALRDDSALGGYLPWTKANRDRHSRELSQAVLSLQQPLAKIAEKVATAQ